MRVLATLGEWKVKDFSNPDAVWADHDCEDHASDGGEGMLYSWVRSDGKAICFHCKAPVPAEVQALVHLYGK